MSLNTDQIKRGLTTIKEQLQRKLAVSRTAMPQTENMIVLLSSTLQLIEVLETRNARQTKTILELTEEKH